MRNLIQLCLSGALLLALPADVQAQFNYTIISGAIIVTGYSGNPTVINIPSTINSVPVTSIRDHAFYGCSSLTSVSIPYTVQSIGAFALAQCSHLTSISVNGSNPLFSSINGALFNKSGTQLIQCPGGLSGSYTIPSSVTSIGNLAFMGCSLLTSVPIPASVASIGDQAFYGCSGLTNILLPSSLLAWEPMSSMAAQA